MAEPVVRDALLGVGEHLVGLGRLLERLLGLLAARVAIRVMFYGEVMVSLLDLSGIRGPSHAEDLVVVAFHHALDLGNPPSGPCQGKPRLYFHQYPITPSSPSYSSTK